MKLGETSFGGYTHNIQKNCKGMIQNLTTSKGTIQILDNDTS